MKNKILAGLGAASLLLLALVPAAFATPEPPEYCDTDIPCETTTVPTTEVPTTGPPTTEPPTTTPPPSTTLPPVEVPDCHPSYTPCLPVADDLDCEDVPEPVAVIGDDEYGLDQNDNGIGCEASEDAPVAPPATPRVVEPRFMG